MLKKLIIYFSNQCFTGRIAGVTGEEHEGTDGHIYWLRHRNLQKGNKCLGVEHPSTGHLRVKQELINEVSFSN